MSKTTRPTIVLVYSFKTFHHPERNMYAAQLAELGLTAYSNTEAKAIASLRRLVSRFVRCHSKIGDLESLLHKHNVRWYWEGDAPAGQPPLPRNLLSLTPGLGTLGEAWVYSADRQDVEQALAI